MMPLDGRVCLVTGASSGIGFETARGLAELGAEVWIVGRDAERTARAQESLRDRTRSERIHSLLCDFSSLEQVRALAGDVLERLPRLHVLVNNAGLWHQQRRLSQDGIEDTLAVNHLAPFLLTNRLRPLLERSAPARVVNVASRLHEGQRQFLFDDMQAERRRYRGLQVYAQSKLANVLFSNELARRLGGTRVVSNSLHPGDVPTAITRDSRFLSFGLRLISPFMPTQADGAATSLYVATDPSLVDVTGEYFREKKRARPARAALDEWAARRLWDISAEMVEL